MSTNAPLPKFWFCIRSSKHNFGFVGTWCMWSLSSQLSMCPLFERLLRKLRSISPIIWPRSLWLGAVRHLFVELIYYSSLLPLSPLLCKDLRRDFISDSIKGKTLIWSCILNWRSFFFVSFLLLLLAFIPPLINSIWVSSLWTHARNLPSLNFSGWLVI